MYPRVSVVKHLEDYRLQLTFRDGKTGVIDLAEYIKGKSGLLQPLQAVAYFAQVKVDPEYGFIFWPNDADFDPDVLYERTILPKEKWKLQLAT